VLAIAIVFSGGALWARYMLSRPAMNDLAADVIAGKRSATSVSRVGLYRVDRVERIPDGMRFLVRGTGFLDSHGFAYSPRSRPAAIGEDFYKHLDGPWYVWRASW